MSLVKLVAQELNLSRRAAERLIHDEGVLVDGVLVHRPRQPVPPRSRLELAGRVLAGDAKVSCRALLYHKPVGEICARTSDPNGVFARLPQLAKGQWIMVGRLDINSSGLLLFTTDGELAYRLMHPRYQLDREYAVRVRGKVTDAVIKRLKQGVKLADGMARFHDLVAHRGRGANQWFYVVVQSGRRRMVRRLWESQGMQVSRLIRVRYAHFILPPDLKSSRYIMLNRRELRSLMACVGYEADAARGGF